MPGQQSGTQRNPCVRRRVPAQSSDQRVNSCADGAVGRGTVGVRAPSSHPCFTGLPTHRLGKGAFYLIQPAHAFLPHMHAAHLLGLLSVCVLSRHLSVGWWSSNEPDSCGELSTRVVLHVVQSAHIQFLQ